MALHDQDKQNSDRANPSLNADDNVQNRMSHKTISPSYKAAGNQDSARLIFDTGSIEGKHDADTKDIFIGYAPEINETRPIIRVAKDGYDARTATSDQLIFNSEQNILKIVSTDTTTVQGILNQSTFNIITHNLGYVPMVIATVKAPTMPGTNRAMMPWFFYPWLTNGYFAQISNVTTTNLQFEVGLGSTAAAAVGNWDITYYLLQESAN